MEIQKLFAQLLDIQPYCTIRRLESYVVVECKASFLIFCNQGHSILLFYSDGTTLYTFLSPEEAKQSNETPQKLLQYVGAIIETVKTAETELASLKLFADCFVQSTTQDKLYPILKTNSVKERALQALKFP